MVSFCMSVWNSWSIPNSKNSHTTPIVMEKQKEGKKKMRQLGSVELPSEAFTAVLKLDED